MKKDIRRRKWIDLILNLRSEVIIETEESLVKESLY